MSIFSVDIETFGHKPSIDDVKAPANYKDEAKIAAYKEENLDKTWRSNALDRYKSDIIAISIVNKSENISECFVGDEKDIILKVNNLVKGAKNSTYCHWMHFNGDAFDLPKLAVAALKHGASDLYRSIPKKKFDDRSIDIMRLFCFTDYRGSVSLKTLLSYFGLQEKEEGLDGSKVHDAWLNKEYDRIAKYCLGDAEKLFDLYNIYMCNDTNEPF